MSQLRNHGDDKLSFHFLLFFFLSLSPMAFSQPAPDPRSDPYQYRLSGSMAVIIVVLIAALFFMAFFSVYVRHCSDSQSNTVRPLPAGRSRRAAHGLDASVIETFPTLIYSEVKEHKIGKGALECAVCLNEFEDDETLRLIPKCDHVFHPECIDAWLGSHTTCPVCRANLDPETPDELSAGLDQPADSVVLDVEPLEHRDAVDSAAETLPPVQQVLEADSNLGKTLNRTRTRGSRSNRIRWLFPRSHSTGHSLVQPGENTERFTLRLPVEVRRQIVNRKLNRASSMVILARQSSSMRGYRSGVGEGSSRGKHYKRLERLDRTWKSDRWVVSITPPFFSRMSSMNIKTPKGANNNGEGISTVDPSRLPV